MSRQVVVGGGALQVRFAFDRRLVDLVKSLPRRRWRADEKNWTVPVDDVVPLVDLLLPEGFSFDDEVRRLYEERGGARTIAAARGLFDGAPERESGDPGDGYTVSRLNREVKAAIERAFPSAIWITGEISGFARNRHKRHVGFNLIERDTAGEAAFQVGAILFEDARREIERKLAAAGNPFALDDELDVRLLARVDLYDAWGAYRIVVEDVDLTYTLGEAARRREEIVRALAAAGLLEKNRSLPFPEVPLRVGLITSLSSDAYHDVLRTLGESGYAFRVTAHGARVQGRATEPSVLNALDWFRARLLHFDVVMICRGGGSRTDLSWFDTDALGRAVATFPIPVVVGIGHEQDLSVLDHVGWRAKTPTAAAGLLVEKVRGAEERLEATARAILSEARSLVDAEKLHRREAAARLARGVRSYLDLERQEIASRRARIVRASATRIEAARTLLVTGSRQLGPRAARGAALERERLEARARRLHLVDPRRVVERGYAILRDEGGRVVDDASRPARGDRLTAELKTGRLGLVADEPKAPERSAR